MLLYFKTSNNLSFNQEVTFSMIAGNYKDPENKGKQLLEKNLMWSEKYKVNVLKAAAIYGANASGKSNFLKAIGNAVEFIRHNFTESHSETSIPFLSEYNKLDSDNLNRPITFCFGILVDDTQFEYNFSYSKERVLSESLLEYRTQKPIEHFTRVYSEQTKDYDWTFSKYFTGEKETVKKITNERSLYLTVGAVSKLEICEKIFQWFDEKIVFAVDINSPGMLEDETILFVMAEDVNVKKVVLELLKKADFAIVDFKFKRLADGGLLVTSVHRTLDKEGKEVLIDFDYFNEESVGTRRFMGSLAGCLDLFSKEKTGLIDEFGTSMHSLLSKDLLKLFVRLLNENKKGKNKLQLIFTTHDTNLMDASIFRKDQIWITERDERGNSRMYPVSDFKTKKGVDLESEYLQGLYGGIPFLKDEKHGVA